MMNRTFHARVMTAHYVILLLLGSALFFTLWHKQILIALVYMGLLILMIERIIHTTYTFTADARLCISHGRFSHLKEISLQDIRLVEQVSSMRVGKWSVLHYLLITDKAGKHTALLPVDEEEFMRVLHKRMEQVQMFGQTD